MVKTTSKAAQPLIELQNCSLVFDGRAVLDDVSFTLRAGERWALVGANGSGKTLLLKLLRGDVWPTPTGRERREYFFDGAPSEHAGDAKEHIAYVGPERQDKYVRYDWNHDVARVVITGLFDEDIPLSQPSGAERKRVARLLKRFGLWSLRRRRFLTLSYGQRRRVLVARAFAAAPQVLLLDEVFNGLDRASAKILHAALQRTRGIGSTWIVTTHRATDIPRNTTHGARMKLGRIDASHQPVSNAKFAAIGVHRRGPPSALSLQPKSAAPLIALRDVDLYRDYRLVLRDVNWIIRHDEHWAITGRNGSGKSTLLKLLYGDLHPKLGGVIEREGVPFGTPIMEWKRRVGFVSPELQADYFLARDIEEVVISGRYASIGLNQAATAADRRAAQRWMKFFGIDALAHRKPRAVSYGQMRLALLARSMSLDPELLLLDEPVTGLDSDMRALLLGQLERVAASGVQLVVAVHNRADLPRTVNRVLEIQRAGRIAIRILGANRPTAAAELRRSREPRGVHRRL